MKKKHSIPEVNLDELVHTQMILTSRQLTEEEQIKYGYELAQTELKLVAVKEEKKEVVRNFNAEISEHEQKIKELSKILDKKEITTQNECKIKIDRVKGVKFCYPIDGSQPFELPLEEQDYDLLT